jgi:hypothetical protein
MICGGTTTVMLLLVAGPATADAPNAPLQPAGAAVTVMFCDPTQPLQLPNVRLAAQLLFRLPMIGKKEVRIGVYGAPLGVTVVVTTLLVSPVDRFSEDGCKVIPVGGGGGATTVSSTGPISRQLTSSKGSTNSTQTLT